jgi:hypothetical protein
MPRPSLGSTWETRAQTTYPGAMKPRLTWLAAPVLAVGLLAGCSADADPDPTGATASPPPTSASSTASPSPTGSVSPSRIVAVLCDEATKESVAAIEAALDPDFTVSQLVDVRADDDATHAVLGFVEGPGLAVLAQWVGQTLELTDLQSADEFAAQVSAAPLATDFPEETQDLLDNTVKCYTTIFGPDEEE